MEMDDVRAFVDPDEPDYEAAAVALGPAALPYLDELVHGDDPMLASKAVYLAGLIGGDEAAPILDHGAGHDDPVVRAATASTVAQLPDDLAMEVGERLLHDPDVGVRHVTVSSAARGASPEVRARLRQVVEQDEDDQIRSMATELDE